MRGEKTAKAGDEDLGTGPMDFRHLTAFQKVYHERSYTHAGHDMFTTRKGILRMIKNMERFFGSDLFTEGPQGDLVPGAFAERLFNDLRFLTGARSRMKDHISSVHESGRMLHIGSTPAVFRTRGFRNLFRGLQSLQGIRVCYMKLDQGEVGKALLSGHCDLFVGCRVGTEIRFEHQNAGSVLFSCYQRGPSDSGGGGGHYVVSLNDELPELPSLAGRQDWIPLDQEVWLGWLNHPGDCPLGSVIFAPDVEMDRDYWQPLDFPGAERTSQPLYASFLRHHSYEFLPMLMGKLKFKASAS